MISLEKEKERNLKKIFYYCTFENFCRSHENISFWNSRMSWTNITKKSLQQKWLKHHRKV